MFCLPCVHYMFEMESNNRVFPIKDLDVVLDLRLTFHGHVVTLAADYFRRLDFIIRNVNNFHYPEAMRIAITR